MARFKDQRFGGRSATNPVTVALEDSDGSVSRYSFTAVAGDATVQFKDDSGNVGSSISVTSGSTVTGPGSDLSGTGSLSMEVTFDASGFRSQSYLDVDVETVTDAELELEPWVPTLGAADGDLFASDGAGGVKAVGSGTYASDRCFIDVLADPDNSSGFNTGAYLSGRFFNIRRAGATQGYWQEYSTPPMRAGTYTFSLYHYEKPDAAIYTVSVDGTDVGAIDGYNASAGNAVDEITGIALTAGRHTVRLTAATKNASSSDYKTDYAGMAFVRTGA